MTFYTIQTNQILQKKLPIAGRSIKTNGKSWSEIVFLCIGSDRVTGDCLGPYIGYRLSQYHIPGVFIYGTLQNPVHAVNLSSILSRINHLHPQALIIAIDSSLGRKKAPGICDHWKWFTLSRCCSSKRSASGRRYFHHGSCKHIRHSRIPYFADNPSGHSHFPG